MAEFPVCQLPEVELVKKLPPKVGKSTGNVTPSKKAKVGPSSPLEQSSFYRVGAQDFPALYKGESAESTALRVSAFHRLSDELRKRFEGIQPEANRLTFEQVEEFVRASHISAKGMWDYQVPVGILYAGGVNPSDHADTFTALRDFLSDRSFYVALVSGRELGSQDGNQNAFRQILRGFSGVDTDVDDFMGVVHWYDEALKANVDPKSECIDKAKGAKSPGTSRKRKFATGDGVDTPRRVTRALSKDVAEKPEKKASAVDQATVDFAQGDVLAGDRPLAIVIDDGESVDPTWFTDFINLLSDARPRLKIALVVGMSTNSETLQRFTLLDAPHRVCCRRFALAPSRRCLEQAFRQVLVAVDGPFVVLGKGLSAALTDQHLHHDSTIEGFKQGLLLACTHHFAQEPLSGYLAALASPLGGGNTDWRNIPDDLHKFASCLLKVKKESLAALMANNLQKMTAWKLGLIWIHEIASSLGKITRASGCTWRDLYCAAVGDGFKNSTGFSLVRSLLMQNGLHGLSRGQLSGLLTNLEVATMEYEQLSLQMKPYLRELKILKDDVLPQMATTDEPLEKDHLGGCCHPTAESTEQQQPGSLASQRKAKMAKPAHRKSTRARREFVMQSFEHLASATAPGTIHTQAASKIAEFLRRAIQDFCGTSPEQLQGSRVFCFGGGDAVRNHLLGAPRLALERALTHPQKYMSNLMVDEDLGVAYQTYKSILGDRLNLADWFLAFSSHFNLDIQADPEEVAPKQKTPKVSENHEKDALQTSPVGGEGGGVIDPKRQMLARFERALIELQFLGFIKKNRDHVKCLIFND